MYVLDTKQLLIVYSVLEKRAMNVLKKSQNDTYCVTSLGRPQDVSLNTSHEIGFLGDFFYIS